MPVARPDLRPWGAVSPCLPFHTLQEGFVISAPRIAAVVTVLVVLLASCSSGLDRPTAEQLQQAAEPFEPPAPWEPLDGADGPYAGDGFPDVWLIDNEFGRPGSSCPAGDDVRCLQLRRVWELDPDNLDSQTNTAPPLLPEQVEQLREEIATIDGWDVTHSPDCILDQDTAAARDDGCTWRVSVEDVEVVLRPQRRNSTEPWQLELYAHHETFAYELP